MFSPMNYNDFFSNVSNQMTFAGGQFHLFHNVTKFQNSEINLDYENLLQQFPLDSSSNGNCGKYIHKLLHSVKSSAE